MLVWNPGFGIGESAVKTKVEMASSKQGKKNRAKEAIGALCHILNSNDFITKITPEHFRQAKFDQPEAVSVLWTLLSELIQLNLSSNIIHISPKDGGANLEKADVQSLLHQMGYRCSGFYGNSDVGSRDILLAIGWLLAKLDFINIQVKVKLEESCPAISTFHLGAVQKKSSSGIANKSRQWQKGSSPSTPVAQAKYLVWLMGRLKLTLKALYCEQQALCAAMHLVHEATQGVIMPHPSHINHLSAWETYILRHPKHLQQYLVELEKQSSILQACVTWREVEPVFWQWMGSVFEAKLSSATENFMPPTSPNDLHHPPRTMATEDVSGRIQQLHDLDTALTGQLQDLEVELESRGANDLLDQLSHPNVHKRKADIDNAVRAKLANSSEEYQKMRSRRYPLQTVQFSFKPEQTKIRLSKPEPLPPNTINIKDEIARMSDGVRRLQEELDGLKFKQQERLDGFAEGLVNVVCIPPMSEKTSYSP